MVEWRSFLDVNGNPLRGCSVRMVACTLSEKLRGAFMFEIFSCVVCVSHSKVVVHDLG